MPGSGKSMICRMKFCPFSMVAATATPSVCQIKPGHSLVNSWRLAESASHL